MCLVLRNCLCTFWSFWSDQVELIEVCGQPRRFKVLKDETGRDRRLAVKRMPWDKINYYRRHLKEVGTCKQ